MPRLNQKKLEEREKLIQLAIQHYNQSLKPSLRISAETYSIACTTLRDRLNGAKTRLEGRQCQQLLYDHEELTIVRWCERMDDWGFLLRLLLVTDMAEYLVSKREIGRTLGKHWLDQFLKQNPALDSKFSARLARQRALTDNPALIRDYFKKVCALSTPVNLPLLPHSHFWINMCYANNQNSWNKLLVSMIYFPETYTIWMKKDLWWVLQPRWRLSAEKGEKTRE